MAGCVNSKTSCEADQLDAGAHDSHANMSSWVTSVVAYSSEYDTSNWCADNVVGPPTVYPKYGDIHGAWAQRNKDNQQYIELEFEKKLYIDEIKIYETYNGGAITKISCKGADGKWVAVWQVPKATRVQQSRIFSPPISKPRFPSKQIRLDMDCTGGGAGPAWCEIDAVQLCGKLYIIDPPPPVENLAMDLKALVNKDIYSDVCFSVEGHEVYAHKAILASRSDYFKAMFASGLQESYSSKTIDLPDVDHQAFLGLLQYLYTNSFQDEFPVLALLEIMRVGDRFTVNGVRQLALCHLVDQVTVDNVVEIYIDAATKLPVLDLVKESCLNFIAQHLHAVTKTKGFRNLTQEHMLEICQAATEKMNI